MRFKCVACGIEFATIEELLAISNNTRLVR